MDAVALSPADQALYDLLSGPHPETIADVVARMQAIDALLPVNDGVKWFNLLYLMVTQQVDLKPPDGAWQSPAWLERLDVIFASLYFGALRDSLAGKPIPSAWDALFAARYRNDVDRIQFAVAGMNAHINRDLALALVATDAALNVTPATGGPEHRDYESINELLNKLIPAELEVLAVDILGVIAQDTGKIGRLLAFWNICKAREVAWDFANHLRILPGIGRDAALCAQDAMTGALGRAIVLMI